MDVFTRPHGTSFTGADVLDVPLGDNEAGAADLRGYLVALLRRLWIDGEGFMGKRPFCDPGWQYDVYRALIRHGFIDARPGTDQVPCEPRTADDIVLAAIDALDSEPAPPR